MTETLKKITVIVPSYKPDHKLIDTLRGLIDEGFSDIIVVDDGGGSDFAHIFNEVRNIPECTTLTHDINHGKGAALKTAFRYYMEYRQGSAGVVTVDADGQHLPGDVASCCEAMIETGSVVLGSRDFSLDEVPPKSKTGNVITSIALKLFFGIKLTDTQTGLRAIPREYVEAVESASGERYEYETNMLFLMKRRNIPFCERRIETVYIEENKSSHFRPVVDSLRIYSIIIKYLLSSAASAITDHVLFFVLVMLLGGTFGGIAPLIAYVPSRAASSALNYMINKKTVFSGEDVKGTLIRYYILAIPVMIISAGAVYAFETLLSVGAPILLTLIKIAVDTILFFACFRIQHQWVFNSKVKD